MGKKYDARKMIEFCESISQVVNDYTVKADILETKYSVYNSNNTYRGEAANASKEFVYRGQGSLTKEQVRVLNKLSKQFNETQDVFSSMVDSAPNAKIDMDVLEKDKRFFEAQQESFEEKAIQLERVSREIRDRFERFGHITTISYDRAKYGFEELCGYSGFMNKCIRTFENFDEETKAYVKSSGIDSYMDDLENETKATMNALDGMTVYDPEVEKITVTPIAQMAAKMMSYSGITAKQIVPMTEGEKLLKLLRLEHSADLPVNANIIKTATDYAVQMCPSKEGTLAIQNCSTAMLAVDGQTLRSAADVAVGFIPIAPAVAPVLVPSLGPIAIGILVGAGIALFLYIIREVAQGFSQLVTPKEAEENSHIIDVPPTEDEKSIIEKPVPTPQENPSVIDIPPGNVEEKELGRDIIPKSPIEEDQEITSSHGSKHKNKGNLSDEDSSSSRLPVGKKVTASNGLDYESNAKHTPGAQGNRRNAGTEPRNSLELFEKSVPTKKDPDVRFSYDKGTGTVHRFYNDGNGTWHWSGSTNQGPNSLRGDDIPIDIKRLFNIKSKGW
ncbi:MAG: hypothetical protein J5802_10915 [Butyrivibrio sp.]|nr:hypothetical protein [Butyrivibrio sp.]